MSATHSRAAHPRLRPPRLSPDWESARSTVFSNLRAVLGGPKAPKIASGNPYLRNTLVQFPLPVRALVASALWHIAVFYFPSPNWPHAGERPRLAAPRIEVTWYAPPSDLTPLIAPPPLVKRNPPSPANKPVLLPGASALHSRRTIISMPKQPTHPRQTLIQPEAPPLPPKILPPLPNIVQWFKPARPAKPRLAFRPPSLAKLRPNPPPSRPPADVPLPVMPNQEKPGELSIAASVLANSQPRLPAPPMSVRVPQAGSQQTRSDAPAAPDIGPGIGNDLSARRVIALSATPAPVAPVIEVPSGNLQARIAISPEGPQPEVPGGATKDVSGETGGSSSAGPAARIGPPEISITGAGGTNSLALSGPSSIGPGKQVLAAPLPAKPAPRLVPPDPGRTRPAPAFDRIKPGAPPETILASKRVYTLYVNLPNLASATGSWVLNFAELEESDPPAGDGALGPRKGRGAADLVGPVPLRKVDPKYPPALVSAHVEGEVLLYAIIRKDGTVDSIQLVKSVDPELDRNAMDALGRWKFRPAQRHGEPVELEAVIHVPFRAVVPF